MAKVSHASPRNHPAASPSAVPEALLTYEEVAERLGTTRRFPKRLAEERRIASVKVGRERRIPRSALDRWIADNTVSAVD